MIQLYFFIFTAGWYCDSDGLSEPVGLCAPGWYCSGGAFSNKPQTYVNGSFTVDISCPTYLMNDTGGMCLAGKFCRHKNFQFMLICCLIDITLSFMNIHARLHPL